MSEIFKVSLRGQIMSPATHEFIPPGTRLTRAEIVSHGMGDDLDRLIRDRWIIRMHILEDPENPSPAPATTEAKPLPSMMEDSKEKREVLTTQPPVKTSPAPEIPAIVQQESKWILDPETLKDKSIEELNVMVQERDADVEPFLDTQTAAAWLSQDYEPETAQVATV